MVDELERLPGTEWSRYALPLEYPPSRDLRPRWGYSRPRIEPLYTWFMEYADDYRARLAKMNALVPELADVPQNFDSARPDMPAWNCAVNPIDSLALYSFVRECRPATYLEIGSGTTTRFARLARMRNNSSSRIISIDPNPRTEIDAICDQVIRTGLETCDLAIFENLVPGDIVFMDGSHRAFMNSDVAVFFIDVLPRLKPGVIVQIHDIALPNDYHPHFTNWYWNEQYMLAVYLMGHKACIKPLLPVSLVCRDPTFTPDLERLDPMFRAEGGSMWFTHT